MGPADPRILTINGGSSSIKFALFEAGDSLGRILEGGIERIGLPEAALRVKGVNQADNRRTAAAVARQLSLDAVEAEIEPAGKVAHVKKLCAEGEHVAMAGNGSNALRLRERASCESAFARTPAPT